MTDRNDQPVRTIADLAVLAGVSPGTESRALVPGDMPVTGFDDLPMASYAVPRLTTVRQDLERGAREMVSALFARMAGEDAPSVEMAAELIVRDTA